MRNIESKATETTQYFKNQFRVNAPRRRHIIAWIADAWSTLTTTTIVNGFQKAGLLNDTCPCPGGSAVTATDVGDIIDAIRELQVTKSAEAEFVDSSDDASSVYSTGSFDNADNE